MKLVREMVNITSVPYLIIFLWLRAGILDWTVVATLRSTVYQCSSFIDYCCQCNRLTFLSKYINDVVILFLLFRSWFIIIIHKISISC
jgi:hypothetical protein